MRRFQWTRISLVLALLLFAGATLWTVSTQSAFARRPKPTSTPTPTATLPPTPTPTPSGPPTPTPTPLPVTGSWQVFPSPTIDVSHSTFGAELNSVAAVSVDDVWAVGYYEAPCCEGRFTLIEHFDGTSWSIVTSPNPDPISNELHAVAGVSSDDIWAVGGRGANESGSPAQSLIEHWNGTAWSVEANPGLNILFGVTALTSDNVWAVAFNSNPASPNFDIVMHWNGTAWATVAAPTVDALGNRLNLRAVTAVSPSDIWAVGDLNDSETGHYYSVTEHFDGTSWKVIGLELQDCTLQGVTSGGPADVWAVDASGLMRAQHFDGVSESVISTPNPPLGSGLYGVAAVSAGDIWAVGYTNTGSGDIPLIEQFTQS